MNNLKLNETPVRTSKSFRINNIKIEDLELPEKLEEFKNVKVSEMGSKISMLYPLSILNGKGAKTEYTGISFAGEGQNLDTGFKVIHNAPNTSSVVNAKSISKNGGKCTYRSLVRINENAQNSKSSV